MSRQPDNGVVIAKPLHQGRQHGRIGLPAPRLMARARTKGAGCLILRKLRGASPHPGMQAIAAITMKQAANRPILTLLFHEQPMSELQPARSNRP